MVLIGIGGLVAEWVRARTKELAIRAAIGSPPFQLRFLAMREGLVLAAFGASAGAAGVSLLQPVVAKVFYGPSRWDLFQLDPQLPTTLICTGFVLALVVAVCAWVPSGRAASRSPADVLRGD